MAGVRTLATHFRRKKKHEITTSTASSVTIISICVAYVATGAFYVVRDLMQPIYNRPGYIRERRWLLAAAMGILWFPWTLRVFFGYWRHGAWRGIKKYFLREALLVYSVFGVLLYLIAPFFR